MAFLVDKLSNSVRKLAVRQINIKKISSEGKCNEWWASTRVDNITPGRFHLTPKSWNIKCCRVKAVCWAKSKSSKSIVLGKKRLLAQQQNKVTAAATLDPPSPLLQAQTLLQAVAEEIHCTLYKWQWQTQGSRAGLAESKHKHRGAEQVKLKEAEIVLGSARRSCLCPKQWERRKKCPSVGAILVKRHQVRLARLHPCF